MSWIRLDDQWYDHPKFQTVSERSQICWIKGLCYASRHLSDGFIPVHVPAKFLRLARHVRVAVQELVKAGLWVEAEGGYCVHNYGYYQQLATKVKAEREAARTRQERWRGGYNNAVSHGVTNGVTNAVTNGVTNGVTNALVTGSPAGARASDVSLSDPDPDPIRSGSTSQVRTARTSSSRSPSSSVPPPPEPKTESGYDLAWRVWSELWAGRYGEAYQRTTDTGAKGDDRTMQRLGALALEHGARAETVLRQKLGRYLASQSPWLLSHRHPPRMFESDWNSFGNAPSKLARVCVESDDEREPTEAELAASRKRMADRDAKMAAERERRAALGQSLERPPAGSRGPEDASSPSRRADVADAVVDAAPPVLVALVTK